jgi:ribosomal protein S18 acetylase RimI-like enzyme
VVVVPFCFTLTVPDIDTLELACARAWPPQVERELGRWRLRAANGYTGRANSALAVGDPGLPMAQALQRVCEFSHHHGIAPLVQTPDGAPNAAAIAEAGWIPSVGRSAGDVVSVRLGPLVTGPLGDTSVLDEPTPGWWELTAGSAEPGAGPRHVLAEGARHPVAFVVAHHDSGGTVGALRAVVTADLLHVSVLAVHPAFRRRGVARALLAAASAWGARRGARRSVLQVATDNEPALALYARLGFTEHRRYRYWQPGPVTRRAEPAAGADGRQCEDPVP